LSVSQCSFTASWRPENAISAQSSTGLIKSTISDKLLLELEISGKTTTFSMLTQIASVVIHEFHT